MSRLQHELPLVAHVREDGAAARRPSSAASTRSGERSISPLVFRAQTVPRCNPLDACLDVSPGIAPDTSTIAPSWRAIMRPPAAGFSTASVTTRPGATSAVLSCVLATVVAHGRQVEVIVIARSNAARLAR